MATHDSVIGRPLTISIPPGSTSERGDSERFLPEVLKSVAKKLPQPCVAVSDAYFAVGPAFQSAKALTENQGQRLLHLITRAKDNVVAYEEKAKAHSGRGRRLKHGKRLKLRELSFSRAKDF